MTQKKVIKKTPKWKYIIGFLVSLSIIYALALIYSYLICPDTTRKELPYTKSEIKKAEEIYTYDKAPNKLPRVVVNVPESQYKESDTFFENNPKASKKEINKLIKDKKLPEWYPRGQSPLLAKLEKEGKLPPVIERTGSEPMVMKGQDGIGKYGGTWIRLATAKNDIVIRYYRFGSTFLFRYSPMGEPIVPNIAKGYKKREGGKIWDIYLRKGMKWSDGTPVTAEDIMYWWKDERHEPLVDGTPPTWMQIGGQFGEVTKLNKYAVRFSFVKPHSSLLGYLATKHVIRPAHYLKKYHPKLGDKKLIQAKMKEWRFRNPSQLYNYIREEGNSYINPEKPVLTPWMFKTYSSEPPASYVRNPYYFGVDEKGNQLPYIDKVYFQKGEKNIIPLAASEGGSSMQVRRIESFKWYSLVKNKAIAKNSKIDMFCWAAGSVAYYAIYPNLNRKVIATDLETKYKAKILKDKHFRQGVSLSINRKAIINSIMPKVTKPSQIEPGIYSPFHSEKLANAYIKYNPKEANKLLDKAWKDMGWNSTIREEGFRCGPNGKILTFYLMCKEGDLLSNKGLQFIADDLAKVGIRLILKEVSRSLYDVKMEGGNFDMIYAGGQSEVIPLIMPRSFVAVDKDSRFAAGWGKWVEKGGLSNSEESKQPGCIPIPKNNPMYKAVQYFKDALSATTLKKQQYYMNKVFDIAAENVWMINVGINPPTIGVRLKTFKNVPNKAINCTQFGTPTNTGPELYYFENPSHVGDKDTLYQLQHTTPRPAFSSSDSSIGAASKSASDIIYGIIYWLIIISIVAFFAILAIKHKFVLKRLIIMVPTIIVVSICVFTIVQLPPGNFVNSKITQLEESGSSPEQIEGQVKALKEMFNFDDPAWKKYLLWTGLKWFVTFDENDKGLLQGYMGRSMETFNSVNSMVGDRILLTFLISLGTIILTWLLAIPIGIYSACRQYSIGDYFFTFLGFIGMCMPGFLIALIFLALTGLSGLFSPKFAVQPFWDWPKVIDLLKHIWIPIVIVGINGTASMVRIMRANLLDELRKPYVTTARAKGVRPLKLLFKYPVRLAINPFISGLGTLFPQLVSGSSIVAIILSLPTVGPMLLNALFAQDMNVAASMLLVLSILGIIGTLISDLLLLALDPRIRLTGGSK